MENYPEHEESLWVLAIGPGIWVLHFLLAYGGGAVICEKTADPAVALEILRDLVLATTLLALLGIAAIGIVGYGRHKTGFNEPPPHEEDKPGDRHRFFGFATVLLCGLSAVATIYVGIVVWFFENCR